VFWGEVKDVLLRWVWKICEGFGEIKKMVRKMQKSKKIQELQKLQEAKKMQKLQKTQKVQTQKMHKT
jgi:hypothetical protein